MPQPSERQMEFLMNLFQIPTDEFFHFDVFQFSPSPLDGVQVRSVRGKEFEADSLPRKVSDILAYRIATMDRDRSQITSQRSS